MILGKNLRLHFDEEADFLEFGIGKPTKGFFKEVGDKSLKELMQKLRK